MKPARKKQRKGKKVVDEYDRFSNLPDSIVHHVFSFLPNNYIPRLSILSRRFKYLCDSSPYYYFEGCFDSIPEPVKYRNFVRCLDKLLFVSSNGLPIYRFRLHFSCPDIDETPPYYRWVENALIRNVQELDLHLDEENPKLPPLKSASLKVLTISRCHLRGVKSINSPSLQKLTIWECTIEECNITVSAERLEILSIFQITEIGEKNSFEIYAPNLKSMVWIAPPLGYTCSKSFIHLQEATISFRSYRTSSSTISYYTLLHQGTYLKKCLAKLLHSVSCARSLRSDIGIIEDIFMDDNNMGFSSIFWDKLHHLYVMASCPIMECQQAAVISFLLQASNLRSLTIKHDWAAYRKYCIGELKSRKTKFNARCKKSENLKYLEEVEMDLKEPRIAQMLRGYLAKHAKGLKKITLTYLD